MPVMKLNEVDLLISDELFRELPLPSLVDISFLNKKTKALMKGCRINHTLNITIEENHINVRTDRPSDGQYLIQNYRQEQLYDAGAPELDYDLDGYKCTIVRDLHYGQPLIQLFAESHVDLAVELVKYLRTVTRTLALRFTFGNASLEMTNEIMEKFPIANCDSFDYCCGDLEKEQEMELLTNSNIKNLSLRNSYFYEDEVVQFVKQWQQGEYKTTKFLHLEIRDHRHFLQSFQPDHLTQRPQYFTTVDGKKIDMLGGTDITSNDGTIATMKVLECKDTSALLTFVVWDKKDISRKRKYNCSW